MNALLSQVLTDRANSGAKPDGLRAIPGCQIAALQVVKQVVRT